LYTYDQDTSGVSKCTGGCLSNWPAYQDKGSTTGLPAGISTIKRTDNGQVQYTYNGKPLYYFTSDSNGQVTGDGVESFSVAKPAASKQSSTPSSSSSDSSNTNSSSSSSSYPY
jgi:predicted lipoprotein with Yx(FWY)xxD motif